MPGVVRMQLPAFSPGGVRQLLDDAGSALDAGEVYQRTGWNPFYVTEVLAAGSERVPTTATSRANPSGLTTREVEVLGLLADGLSYAEVAEHLIVSQKTVGHHVSSVLRKLGEPTRSRAVAAALRRGIISAKLG